MSSIAAYLHPALWHGWFDASVDQIGYSAFWLAVLEIIVINLLLSGDNAVVIAMACRGLPPKQRRWGLIIGAGAAVLLRIVFTVVIARVMALPYLKLAGGVALLVIAARLLIPDETEGDEGETIGHLWRAVWVVVVADVIMSLDNIVAVAAAARGNFLLLAIGLLIAIPLIVAGAALVGALLDRFPILAWAGVALLGWVAGEVIVGDPVVAGRVIAIGGEELSRHVELAASGAAAFLAVAAAGLWRQAHDMRVDMRVRARAVQERGA